MKEFCKKISAVLKTIFGYGILICLFAGGLTFFGYLAALIIGGETAAAICVFIYKTIIPMIVRLSTSMVLLGLLKVILTLMLVAVNPLLGAISAFFSGNKVGMALGKSVMCSFVLAVVCVFMNFMDFYQFRLEDLTLLACSLPMIVLAILWVVMGHVL